MKNILRKAALLTILYYAAAGCVKCTCPPTATGKFEYTGMSAENLLYYFPANATFQAIASTADTIDKDQYGIHMQLAYELVYNPTKTFTLCNAAYACSCLDSQYTLADSVINIDIITLDDLNPDHPAGSDISKYFQLVNYNSYSNETTFTPVNSNRYLLHMHTSAMGNFKLDLYFRNEAHISKALALEVVIRYKSGKTLSARPEIVFLR